ncbi:MAG: hypothetical protein AB7V14_06275 [Kiritimatiellia bacterium]
MTIRRIIVLMLGLSFIQLAAHAGEPLKGAFGFTLGDVFDPTNATKVGSEMCYFRIDEHTSTERTVPIYWVATTNAPKVFFSIFLEITPKSHKIYRITAKGNELSKEEREALETTLRSRYTTSESKPADDKVIDQGNRYVRIRAVRRSSGYINIPSHVISELTYTDENLLRQALKEEAEKTFDKSTGL